MSTRTSTIFTIAGVTVLGGALAYAVYFDYKRRNDAEFRKKLRELRLRPCSTERTHPVGVHRERQKTRRQGRDECG